MTLGHLKAGVTPAQAAADLDSLAPTWNEAIPEMMAKFTSGWRVPAYTAIIWAVQHRHS